MKPSLWAGIVTLLFALAGVLLWQSLGADPHAARWQDYLARLSRITDIPIPASTPLPLRSYPSDRELKQSLPDHRINLLDYIELRHCDLMALVSQRNSALGKLQAASLRLDYEQRFIQLARQCLKSNTLENPDLVRLLNQAIEDKQAALPRLRWNMLAAGPELRHFLSLSPSAEAGDSQGALSSLALLVTILFDGQEAETAQTRSLDNHLEPLFRSQAGGVLLRRQALALENLNRANRMLDAIEPTALCPRNRASSRARRLRNVLDNIWGPSVQHALAQAQRQRDKLAASLARLAAQTVATDAFRDWQAHYFGPDGLETQLQQALKDHVSLWQSRLRPCGLAPGQF